MTDFLLTRKEVAAYLRCGETTVKQLTATGPLNLESVSDNGR